jgi:glucokinase
VAKDAIIGVDLGGTNVRAGKVRDGRIETSTSRRISGKEAADVVLGEIFETIDTVMGPDVRGIGFCVPSVVDVEKGIVYTVENIPSWTEVPLKEELERRYGVQACVNNDANAFAVGELHFGQGRGYRNLVGIILGTGLGAGVVVDGHLYSGTNCGAGEIGNIPYRDATIERYCSGEYLQRVSGVDGRVLSERAAAGDRAARELFAGVGTAFGQALLIVLYAFDPEIIVLGGSVSRALPMFEKEMRAQLDTFAFPRALERLKIVRSEMTEVALLGAAAIYLDAMARE